ncbi:MAG: single-stranded DNA-binding protein [Bacillota bacterium]|jgi:single-strand DNA-binding protein|nr:single-stranded DNA-binding protein [Bacillota bacterium]HHU30049.1 single-stranded DNA-binding protein [Bacillota bacterium]
MLNRIVLIGRLTRDPELRYTPASGVAVATFTLAVNRIYSKQKEADFIPIVVWRNQAENCAKFLGKGSLVGVDGRLQIRSYEDREGRRRTVAEVVADSVHFLDSRERRSVEEEPASFDTFDETFDETMISDDDVPF